MDVKISMRKFKAGIFQALAHEDVVIAQSNKSEHLAILRNKLIVETRKDANSIYYRFLISALGASKTMIGAPTGVFVVIASGKVMAQADFAKQFGEEQICPYIKSALERVRFLRGVE